MLLHADLFVDVSQAPYHSFVASQVVEVRMRKPCLLLIRTYVMFLPKAENLSMLTESDLLSGLV